MNINFYRFMTGRITDHLPRTANNRGVALILTFIFMISLTIITVSYLFMVSVGTKNVASQVSNVKGGYLAESGLNKAVWFLNNTAPDDTTDGSWRTTAYPAAHGTNPTDPQQESLGNGTYTMWVETSGSDIQVTARGTYSGIERIIRETVTLGAGAYQSIADTTVSGNRTFTAGTYSGIWYVDGRVTINDNVTFNGTIVATGNIVLTNTDNFASTPTSNYPALVSDATITGSRMGSATINGLVYAATSIDIPRGTSNTINGSMISGGDIDLNRGTSWAITYDSDLASDPPPYFEGTGSFDYAMYSDGSIEFNNAGGTVTGDIATTGTVDNEGGMTITGTITESSSVVAPTVTTTGGGSATGDGWVEL